MSVKIPVQCSGETHHITVTDDYDVVVDPEKHDVEMEDALIALGATPPACLKILESAVRRGVYARHEPDLTPEQRFMLGMTAMPFARGSLAYNIKDLDPDQRMTLAKAGEQSLMHRIAIGARGLSGDQRYELGMLAPRSLRYRAARSAPGLTAQQRYELLKDEPRYYREEVTHELLSRGYLEGVSDEQLAYLLR
jgi:hypothetical protein